MDMNIYMYIYIYKYIEYIYKCIEYIYIYMCIYVFAYHLSNLSS